VIADESLKAALSALLSHTDIAVKSGQKAIEQAASEDVDLIMAAIMGFAGLRPIIKAIESGTNIAIANKEPLVAAGEMIMNLAKKTGAKILPVDSEHNAIFQVFENENRGAIDKITITASGGPFLNWSHEDIASATPEQAVNHPNWDMGAKISVDSASMMNKALEVIEAHYLFSMPPDQIDVIIHPQSVIHSMVSYTDGTTLAQMGASDMKTPIAYALGWPERMHKGGDKLDLKALSSLTFQPPNLDQFPALKLAYDCLEKGQGACITLNAANEIAVAAFLNNEISFSDIVKCVDFALEHHEQNLMTIAPKTVEDIEKLDNTIRHITLDYIQSEKVS